MDNTTTIPIIYWTKWFNSDQWEGYAIDKCNLPYTCKITHNRTKVVDSSVLIFHASDMNDEKDMPPLSKSRAWVYHNAEAPKNTPKIIDQMQYSMTYRLDSDFPWGYLEKQSLLPVMETPLVQEGRMKKKAAPVAWIVSNCKASNYRDHYVKELSKWIDVDIYGHCMNNQVFPDNTTTSDLISNYYFYLSMENSNCKDYVTEKLSNAYIAGVVPIVDGPSDYSPFIPNTRSVIRIDDFDTPKDLATYLKALLLDSNLYNEYLSYRRPDGLSDQFKNTLNAFEQGRCDLCTLAYQRHTNMSLYYPGKKIYLDNTCVSHKHFSYRNYSDILTFYIPLLLLAFGLILFLSIKYQWRGRRFVGSGYKKTATIDA
jgi:hypothetical protein